MTLRHFQIFVTVCDAMNMTAAANTLFMSQPAVSQAISELEAHYDVRLFERLSRKLYLTQAGEKLLGYARHIIRMNRDAEGEMRALSKNGSIRIGASVTIGACVLPKLIRSFKGEITSVAVEVTEGNTAQIEQLIICDKLDLGLVEGEVTLPDIISKPFSEDTLVLICGKNHPFSRRVFIEPQELEGENFILREEGSGTRKTFEDAMSENALTWTSTWTCSNADTIKMAVAEGLGVSVISERAVCREIESGILHSVKINGLFLKRRFKLVYHKNKYLTEAMKCFIRFCFSWEN
ncbi:LysR family transcriptional regulator [Geosporobacter ferrireducens]|uniref:Transcriptional regulator n=1 Tax=Geosporobacter ferrireducens TaxID=1424294 RepID=A0A1D8GN21_9FIRM|nr:LysR family transcriptional regulator [Geosporobacter ferrireducens]AOT72319.1 transcriptional regulator [Geosporobacter ferrireducens]